MNLLSKEEKMLSCFANILYIKEGIRISPMNLKSTHSQKVLSQEIIDIIKKYQSYFAQFGVYVRLTRQTHLRDRVA